MRTCLKFVRAGAQRRNTKSGASPRSLKTARPLLVLKSPLDPETRNYYTKAENDEGDVATQALVDRRVQ